MPEATVTVTVTYTTVDSPADMTTALEQALTRGYLGTITAMADEAATRWVLVLNTPSNTSPVQVRLDDVLMWDGAAYQALSAADFAARYAGS